MRLIIENVNKEQKKVFMVLAKALGLKVKVERDKVDK